MQHRARYAICGTVEGIDRKESKSTNGAPPLELRVVVYNQGKGANYYKVSVYDTKYIDACQSLAIGQEVYVSGRLTGGISDKGYYNYYLTAERILLDILPVPGATSDNAPDPRMSATDIPF